MSTYSQFNWQSDCSLDKATVLDRVGGDEDLLREIASIFLDDYPNLMREIRAAIDSGDPNRLEHAAHTLKGSVSNFGAAGAVDAAYKLEVIGRQQRMMEAPEAFRILEAQFSLIKPALLEFSR